MIRTKVQGAAQEQVGDKLESRFVFHGPPLEILEKVFDELAALGGISVAHGQSDAVSVLPVLLQLPPNQTIGANPDIGRRESVTKATSYTFATTPIYSSFVALMPPGQHNNRSVASTTEEFGMNASNNTGHATFEAWWEDRFVQQLVTKGLEDAGVAGSSQDEARMLVGRAAAAVDEIAPERGWKLLSRLYSIPDDPRSLPAGSAIALACGMPPCGMVASMQGPSSAS